MSPFGYTRPPRPVTRRVGHRAESSLQGRRWPVAHGPGGFTLGSSHGGQVAWKAARDPKQTYMMPGTWRLVSLRSIPRRR